MEKLEATSALAALSQPLRLDIFRLLIRAGRHGQLAGEIAGALGVRQNTLSNNLSILRTAGLVRNHREGRTIRYRANTDGIRDLVAFLMEDCCQGRPEICAPLVARRSSLLDEAPLSRDSYTVLFLCTGNSARSLMAEAILNREGAGRFRAVSAGSMPAETGPHPFAIELLTAHDHDISALFSKSWDAFATDGAPDLDFVLTVCDKAAAEFCPVWPGQPLSAHWSVPDPVAAGGTDADRRLAFSDAYRMMHNRISTFLNLPMDTLGKLALQARLDEIGQTRELAEDG